MGGRREGGGWARTSDEAAVTAVEQRGPAVGNDSDNKEGTGDMTKTPISVQDLRRSLYVKAKAEPTWRFWGLYVHVCKRETLREAYQMAKANNGAPGIDGVTFEAIEEGGVERFLQQITERTEHQHVSTHCGPEEGNSEGRRHESPRSVDRGRMDTVRTGQPMQRSTG